MSDTPHGGLHGRRIGRRGVLCVALGLALIGTAGAADGDLDPLWDGDGIHSLGVAGTIYRGAALALQCDGKVVVAGVADGAAEDADLLVVRFKDDGSLDPSFASGGIFTISLGDYGAAASDVAILPNGRIVVVGTATFELGGNHVVVMRLSTGGALDTTFSNDGLQFFDFGGPSSGRAVALQDDGRIVVVGDTTVDSAIGIARLTTTGALDNNFDGDGKVLVDFTLGDDEGWDVAIQDDGRLVVAGTAGLSGGSVVAVMRLLENGTLDPSFGTGGGGAVPIDFGVYSEGRAVTLQPDGRIVVAGFTDQLTSIAVARLTTGGELDSTFSGDGMVTRDFNYGLDEGWDVAMQGDGRIVVAGSAYVDGLHYQAILRYNTDGTPDDELGGYGYRLVSFGADAYGRGLAVQPADRKILVTGYLANGPTEAELTVLRTIGDQSLLLAAGFECGGLGEWSAASP